MLSVITVATEIDDGIATVSPAARTAHHCDTSLRASRYTGTAVSAQKSAFTTLNHGYAASRSDETQRTSDSTAACSGPKPYSSPRKLRPSPSTSDDAPIM